MIHATQKHHPAPPKTHGGQTARELRRQAERDGDTTDNSNDGGGCAVVLAIVIAAPFFIAETIKFISNLCHS